MSRTVLKALSLISLFGVTLGMSMPTYAYCTPTDENNDCATFYIQNNTNQALELTKQKGKWNCIKHDSYNFQDGVTIPPGKSFYAIYKRDIKGTWDKPCVHDPSWMRVIVTDPNGKPFGPFMLKTQLDEHGYIASPVCIVDPAVPPSEPVDAKRNICIIGNN